jgi:hypothetical protein
MLSSMMQLLPLDGHFAGRTSYSARDLNGDASIECGGFSEPDKVIGF